MIGIYIGWNVQFGSMTCLVALGLLYTLLQLAGYTVSRATGLLPLCAKLIDKRLLGCVRCPAKIKTIDINADWV
jgi:hypothetical protein